MERDIPNGIKTVLRHFVAVWVEGDGGRGVTATGLRGSASAPGKAQTQVSDRERHIITPCKANLSKDIERIFYRAAPKK